MEFYFLACTSQETLHELNKEEVVENTIYLNISLFLSLVHKIHLTGLSTNRHGLLQDGKFFSGGYLNKPQNLLPRQRYYCLVCLVFSVTFVAIKWKTR